MSRLKKPAETSFRSQQLRLCSLALNSITNSMGNEMAVRLAFYEIILNTGPHGLDTDIFVVNACKHHNRYIRIPLLKARNSSKTVAVRRG